MDIEMSTNQMDCITNVLNFTSDNHAVWNETVKQKEIFLNKYRNYIYEPYLDGYNKLNLNSKNIPSLEFLTKLLSLAGWMPVLVNGYISAKAYTGYLLDKKVPISTYIRSRNHINYAPAPDLIHDIIGHLPLLFCEEYVDYLLKLSECINQAKPGISDIKLYESQKKLADLGTYSSEDKDAISQVKKEIINIENDLDREQSTLYQLEKLFLWTIEFGIISENGFPKLYGAGLMSSTLEAESICNGKIQITPFSQKIISTKFNFSNLQTQIFSSSSFNALKENLAIFKSGLLLD